MNYLSVSQLAIYNEVIAQTGGARGDCPENYTKVKNV